MFDPNNWPSTLLTLVIVGLFALLIVKLCQAVFSIRDDLKEVKILLSAAEPQSSPKKK